MNVCQSGFERGLLLGRESVQTTMSLIVWQRFINSSGLSLSVKSYCCLVCRSKTEKSRKLLVTEKSRQSRSDKLARP